MIPLPQRQIETFPGVPQALLSSLEMTKPNADARGCAAAAASLKLTKNALKPLSTLSAFGAVRKQKPGRTDLMSYNLLPVKFIANSHPQPKGVLNIKRPLV